MPGTEGPGCRFSHRGTNATPRSPRYQKARLRGELKEVEKSQHNNPSFMSFKIIRIIVQFRRLTILRQQYDSHVTVFGEISLGRSDHLLQR